jgi:Predicted signal-transduction protein containing cAMP-binding and CBS domains
MQGSFLAGILTERDVLKAAASGTDLTASKVSEWMTPDPQSASPDTPAEEAAQIMLMNGFRHLPVVDDHTVCGVVSLRDLFAARIRRPPRAEAKQCPRSYPQAVDNHAVSPYLRQYCDLAGNPHDITWPTHGRTAVRPDSPALTRPV